MIRVEVRPELLRWSRERAGLEIDQLHDKFPRYREWEEGATRPTLNQLEQLAKITHTAVGYFFLTKPPDESLPIPDFRTIGSSPLGHPTPNLLDTIYLCQRRQDWYREFVREEREHPVAFGKTNLASNAEDIEKVAEEIRSVLDLDLDERRAFGSWTEALRHFIDKARESGPLVMVSGIVGLNTRRKLDPIEFRGFALADDLAPLVFVNGADTKAAQMFTLAHELAHLWRGVSALSNVGPDSLPTSHRKTENWCNRVAAELLVPLSVMRKEYRPGEDLNAALARLARRFKVSTLVILRRIFDIGELSTPAFRRTYEIELNRLKSFPKAQGGGGNFYQALYRRADKRFVRAVVASALEGKTSFTESIRLLGFKKISTFDKLARQLELPV